jgi:hypothetical protein
MNKDTVNVYWAPFYDEVPGDPDWSFLYPKPKNLFSLKLENKNTESSSSNYFACPPVSKKMKNTYVFSNHVNSSYVYNKNSITATSQNWIGANNQRPDVTTEGPLFLFSLSYIFFADQPLDTFFSPPYFHEPKYTKYATVIPSEFDIGQWFRPFNFELQTWSASGEIHLQENEPLFYTEFKTDKKIKINRFAMNEKLSKYSLACTQSKSIFGQGESLLKKYTRFNNVGLREKILTEIKNNLIEE